jgi:hypothetical protein
MASVRATYEHTVERHYTIAALLITAVIALVIGLVIGMLVARGSASLPGTGLTSVTNGFTVSGGEPRQGGR